MPKARMVRKERLADVIGNAVMVARVAGGETQEAGY